LLKPLPVGGARVILRIRLLDITEFYPIKFLSESLSSMSKSS